jgi:hypothetical protein
MRRTAVRNWGPHPIEHDQSDVVDCKRRQAKCSQNNNPDEFFYGEITRGLYQGREGVHANILLQTENKG